MRTYLDQRYIDERNQFELRATCEHCRHFDPEAVRCSLSFPVEPHLSRTHDRAEIGDCVMFCKHFELW